MWIKTWKGFCLASADETLFPKGCKDCPAPFDPLVILIRRDGLTSRGIFAIHDLAEVEESEGVNCLLPLSSEAEGGEIADFVAQNGATVLNTTFSRAFDYLSHYFARPAAPYRVTLVGLGDVGGTVAMGLKLLGEEIGEIAIFDPNEAMCRRYEMELNQILPLREGQRMPRITICKEEDLFRCDLFLFTASRGVPAVGSGVKDVRMAQFDANRAMLDVYAKRAREAGFMGLFCQISDPVDHLAREVFLASNRDEAGAYRFDGLLPEQVQGFGLGVMAARAAYLAEKSGVDFTHGRVYGPHGAGLLVANSCHSDYDEALSQQLTEKTRTVNLAVRELGFKPYIAPGLSSAAISILRLIRGQEHYGAVPLGGTYFGCLTCFTPKGIALTREDIAAALYEKIQETYASLRQFDYEV